jgi:hypothetical protein
MTHESANHARDDSADVARASSAGIDATLRIVRGEAPRTIGRTSAAGPGAARDAALEATLDAALERSAGHTQPAALQAFIDDLHELAHRLRFQRAMERRPDRADA